MFHKLFKYSIPLYLLGLEAILGAFSLEVEASLVGPTLAGAGIGLLAPLTKLKDVSIPADARRELDAVGAKVHLARDESFVEFVWIMFVLSLACWLFTVHLASASGQADAGSWPLVLGCVVFGVAIGSSEYKERL